MLGISIRFSALQRAENSSTYLDLFGLHLPKSFSALQRAENSSIQCNRRCQFPCNCVSVLFSEPKIPQQALLAQLAIVTIVSVLFSEPKIPQLCRRCARRARYGVSVLFSEPKIPQVSVRGWRVTIVPCFSALQRAENSSINLRYRPARTQSRFQCSSASRKFLKRQIRSMVGSLLPRFSALQRAENSSIGRAWRAVGVAMQGFSALQRAENSSIARGATVRARSTLFQCSSASRKFLNQSTGHRPSTATRVSVLFSEPKIPQPRAALGSPLTDTFQCSSASRKFLNSLL